MPSPRPPPPPPPPAMPPPPSAIATRFVTHWIADALSGDESLEFSVLQALLRASSEPLAGAPEATRERVALRSLLELSSLVPAGGDDAATAGVLRVDGARSGEDVLFRLIREVEISGKLEKDLLPPFSQDIRETIRTKKFTLPETSFQLLKGVDPWITSTTPPSQLEHNGTEQCGNDQTMCSGYRCENIKKVVFPTDNAEVQQVTMSSLVYESETANLQKDPSAPTSVLHQPCTPKSRPCAPPLEDTTDAVVLGTRSPEMSPVVEGNMSDGSLLASAGCDAPLEGSITVPFSQQDKHDHTATIEPNSCGQKSPNLPYCADGEGADDGGANNQDIGDTLEDLSKQDFCMKCGKDGELLECGGCLLPLHERCFGSLVKFEDTNLFYCPYCIFKKAKEEYKKAQQTYNEVRKNIAAFFGTAQVSKQDDEQLNGVQPGTANKDGHSNVCDTSKRNSIHHNEAYGLAHREGESHQPRKRQKINSRGNGYPEEELTDKVTFDNFGHASMNKHSVLHNNRKTRVEHTERQAEDKEAGNDNSSHKIRASPQIRCDPPGNQDDEAEQKDSFTVSDEAGGYDELGAMSSNDPSKRPPPPWRNIRHNKKRFHKESAVPSKSSKGIAKQDQHMSTSARKRSSVKPQKRYSNPVAPPGRRQRLDWTKEEEAVLRDAMAKFTPQDGSNISWIQILEGCHGLHKTRLPSDLRSKWKNMTKKPDAGNLT